MTSEVREAGVDSSAGLGALVELTSGLASAESIEQVCERGLAVVEEALGVERASVLLFDDLGVMRFRAWSGLSDAYRSATEGHSPWTPDTRDAEPIVVEDVTADPELAHLREVVLAEGIRALAFVPVSYDRRVVGKYMLYFGEPRSLSADELKLAQIVADQIALAVKRHRDEAALVASQDQLRTIFSGVADAITVQGHDGELVYANEAAARFLGASDPDELCATPVAEIAARFEILDEDGSPLPVDELPARRVLSGEPSAERLVRYRIRATGEERISLVKASPVLDGGGTVRLAVNIIQDVTAERRRREWEQYLASAGAILSESLVAGDTMTQVVELAVPSLADWCGLHTPNGANPPVPVAVTHREPEKTRIALELLERYPTDPKREGSVGWCIDTGRPALYEQISDEMLVQAAVDEDHLRLLQALELGSAMIVPLTARGRTVAAMTFATTGDGRRYNADDLAAAEEFARRAGLAIDNALLHEAEQAARREAELSAAVAHRLQLVTAALAGAITRKQVAEVIAGQGVLALGADAGAVFVLADSGDELELLAQVGYDGERVPEYSRTPLSQPGPTTEAFLADDEVVVENGEELVQRWPHYAEAQKATGDEATIAVPLPVGKRPGGAVYVAFRAPRSFDDRDLDLVRTLARQCGQALERAELYEREHEVALTLQRSLLPRALPATEAVELAAVYWPGSQGLNVGGDWYDALELPNGKLGLVVGDVVGRGLPAATVMGELRNAMRPYLLDGLEPDRVLQRVNALALRSGDRSLSEEAFATAAVALVDVERGKLQIACAGHPPPLVVEPGGAVAFLECEGGPPIGAVDQPSYRTSSHPLPPGTTLILYTDGLVERRGRPLEAGLEQLATVVQDVADQAVEELCERVVAAMVEGDVIADDLALLVARLR